MPSVTGTNGAGSGLPAPTGFGVFGNSDTGPGVVGFSQNNTGVRGYGGISGAYGASDNVGVFGETGSPEGGAGVVGRSVGTLGYGVVGEVSGGGTAIWGTAPPNSLAGHFEGDVIMNGKVTISGSLLKPGGSFRIDHPLDPGNKYLSHSFVQSPDMLNIYNGLIRLDEHGAAIVELPEWFDALNHEFRYQLTPIGSPAPNLHIASEIEGRSFRIAGGTAKGKVSWQVTGIRQDKWANANRIQVDEEKPSQDRGRYLHPELFGEPEDKKVMPVPRPKMPYGPEERLARVPPHPDQS